LFLNEATRKLCVKNQSSILNEATRGLSVTADQASFLNEATIKGYPPYTVPKSMTIFTVVREMQKGILRWEETVQAYFFPYYHENLGKSMKRGNCS
jgi:hypothetical protein